MKQVRIRECMDEFKKLFRTGFFHIFTAQVINKIITFCSSVLVIRILSKADFGIYSYANNIISIFLLLSGLGAVSGLLQYGSENRNNMQKLAAYSNFAWKMGLLANAVICVLIIVYALFIDIELEGAALILLMMCLRPITSYIYLQIEMGFRIRLQNKAYSALTALNSALMLGFTVLGAAVYQLFGIVLFHYLAYIISIAAGAILAKKCGHACNYSYVLTSDEKKSFIKLSFVSSMNNGISQMLFLLDVYAIGIIIPNAEVIAAYKAATTIPFAMLFVPTAIIAYLYPYFVSHNRDIEWVRHNYFRMLRRLIIMNGLIAIGMYVCAPLIIKVVFGYSYIDSIKTFQILAIGYFIAATFRIPSGNILVSLHKVMFNFYNAVISGVANIVLNIVLIAKIGSIGAAYATVTIYIISSLISTVYLNKIISGASK